MKAIVIIHTASCSLILKDSTYWCWISSIKLIKGSFYYQPLTCSTHDFFIALDDKLQNHVSPTSIRALWINNVQFSVLSVALFSTIHLLLCVKWVLNQRASFALICKTQRSFICQTRDRQSWWLEQKVHSSLTQKQPWTDPHTSKTPLLFLKELRVQHFASKSNLTVNCADALLSLKLAVCLSTPWPVMSKQLFCISSPKPNICCNITASTRSRSGDIAPTMHLCETKRGRWSFKEHDLLIRDHWLEQDGSKV